MKEQALRQTRPVQHQVRQSGIDSKMLLPAQPHALAHPASPRLEGKVALISGGDSDIGRAVAVAFAEQGADIAFIYMNEPDGACATAEAVEATGRECLKIATDAGDETLCRNAVDQVVAHFGKLDILVNHATEPHPQSSLEDVTEAQLLRTFQSNVFSTFYLSKAALPYLEPGARIINTASVTAYRGNAQLLDYAAANGAVIAFTRSLSLSLIDRGILVNAVAPGPVRPSPILPTCDPARFASGQPDQIAGCYVFLAGADSVYMSGQVLHPNGGEIVNG
jgi:NAD(P)-dependent dehydrogenase (short-subunit alcohol dehydrogenase family)